LTRINSRRLETKDEPTDIEAAFAAFTTKANATMATLVTDVKAANDNAAAATKRADDLEMKINRPGSHANDNKEPTVETKAFETFVRKGREGLTLDESKSLRVSDDTAGGYIAPDAFVAQLDRNVSFRHLYMIEIHLHLQIRFADLAADGMGLRLVVEEEAGHVARIQGGGYGFACEYDVECKLRKTRLYQVAPISTNLILSYVAEHVLGLQGSF